MNLSVFFTLLIWKCKQFYSVDFVINIIFYENSRAKEKVKSFYNLVEQKMSQMLFPMEDNPK